MINNLIRIKSNISIYDTKRATEYLTTLSELGLSPVRMETNTGIIYCRKDEPKKLKYIIESRPYIDEEDENTFINERKEYGWTLVTTVDDLYIFNGDVNAIQIDIDTISIKKSAYSHIYTILGGVVVIFVMVILTIGYMINLYKNKPLKFYLNEFKFYIAIVILTLLLISVVNALGILINLIKHFKDNNKYKLKVYNTFIIFIPMFIYVCMLIFSASNFSPKVFTIDKQSPTYIKSVSIENVFNEKPEYGFYSNLTRGIAIKKYVLIEQCNDVLTYELIHVKTLSTSIANKIYESEKKDYFSKNSFFTEEQCNNLNIIEGYYYEGENSLEIQVLGEDDYMYIRVSYDYFNEATEDKIYDLVKNR